MDLVIRDARAVLIGNGTLTAIVPAVDIIAAYTAEVAGYPHIALDTVEGSAMIGLAGINSMVMRLSVFSDVSKLQAYQIYDLVRALLHNTESSITSADRLFHAIYETNLVHSYSAGNDVWMLVATYQIIYSVSGVVVTSGASGVIYADASDVTAVAGKKIADFRGAVTLDIQFNVVQQTEQERFSKAFYTNAGRVGINITEVIFKEAALDLLYGITANASDTLADGSTAATSRTITQSIVPVALQFLFQATRTDTGKKLEIEARKAICPAIQIPFSRKDLTVYDCEWICFGDSSDDVVRMSTEN